MSVVLTLLPFIIIIAGCGIVRINYYLNSLDSSHVKMGSGEMFDSIAPYYDTANKFMALGLDMSWRKKLVGSFDLESEANKRNKVIIDLATGTGDVAILLALDLKKHAYADSSIIGIDPSINMLSYADSKLVERGLKEYVTLQNNEAGDMKLIQNNSIDMLSMSFGIRNVFDKMSALREMKRVLKVGGGKVSIMEFVQPRQGFLAPVAKIFLQYVVPTLGALISRGHANEYDHLRKSILEFPTPEEFRDMMSSVGFSSCEANNIFFDVVHIFTCLS